MIPPVPDIPTLDIAFVPVVLAIGVSFLVLMITGSMQSDTTWKSRTWHQGRAFRKAYFTILFLGARHGRH